MTQHALFDAVETPIPPPGDPHRDCDMLALSQLAILYTATEKGNNSGIRFGMSVDDAMVFCESDISRGVLHGTRWAYFWTRLSSFISCYWMSELPVIDLHGASDDGSWDARIAALGLVKIDIYDFDEWLRPHGVEVANCPYRPRVAA